MHDDAVFGIVGTGEASAGVEALPEAVSPF
jgi:hypothetical protein